MMPEPRLIKSVPFRPGHIDARHYHICGCANADANVHLATVSYVGRQKIYCRVHADGQHEANGRQTCSAPL
jgi:hypothetical protein